jgi:hypothetical protein
MDILPHYDHQQAVDRYVVVEVISTNSVITLENRVANQLTKLRILYNYYTNRPEFVCPARKHVLLH